MSGHSAGQKLAYVYFKEEPGRRFGGEAPHPRRSAADSSEHREAARTVAPKLRGGLFAVHDAGGEGEIGFAHACKLGCEGIVTKRLGSSYRSGRSRYWLKIKNPKAPAVKREVEEDWGR